MSSQWDAMLIKLGEKEPGKAEKKASDTKEGAGMQVVHGPHDPSSAPLCSLWSVPTNPHPMHIPESDSQPPSSSTPVSEAP